MLSHSSGKIISSSEKVSLVKRQGSIALVSVIVLSVVNVPAAVVKVLGVVLLVGRFRVLASFQEMMPLSVQHWSINAWQAILCLLLSSNVRMVIGCRASSVRFLEVMCISSPREAMLGQNDSSSASTSSIFTIGEC